MHSVDRPSTPKHSTFLVNWETGLGKAEALGNLGDLFLRLGQNKKAVEFQTNILNMFPVSWGTGLGKAGR